MTTTEQRVDGRAAFDLAEARDDLEQHRIGKVFADLDRVVTESHDRAEIEAAYELALKAYSEASFIEKHVSGGKAILRDAERALNHG